MASDDKPLLILDVNGLLCYKLYKPNYDEKNPPCDNYDKIKINNFYVYLRPDIKSFLSRCFVIGDVGFWSSTTRFNAEPLLDYILTDSQKDKVIFRWYRDHTRFNPLFGKDPEIKVSDTIKDLNDIWSNPVVNRDRKYNQQNTILCDDDPKKVSVNEDKNIILAETFDPWKQEYDDTVIDDLIYRIDGAFEALNT